MKSFFTVLLFACLSFSVWSQQHIDKFYKSDFTPPELNATGVERIEELLQNFGSEQRHELGYSKKRYREFVYKYNYYSEQLNKSGEVFYGDTISQYLNDLKDFLLAGDSLSEKVTIYFTQNPSPNAFTNDFGSIYFNVGLFARLQSEEELLTVLAHEITHIKSKHTHRFEAFQKQKNWDKEEVGKFLSRHHFSQKQEYEADYGALRLLAKRGVPLNASLSVFNILQFDGNPVLFGVPSLKLLAGNNAYAEKYWNNAYQNCDSLFLKFDSLPEPPDSLQTHPSPQKRLDSARVVIKELNRVNSNFQAIGNFQFYSQIAQQVLLRSYLEDGWLQSGLHLCLKMREENPKDTFLVKTQARFLTLIVQDKYNCSPWDQVLNLSGRNISDHGFLHFKETHRSLNALEFNLLALLSVKQMKTSFSIAYLDRIDRYLTLFLYKHNSDLFESSKTGICFVNSDSLSDDSYRINLLDTSLVFTNTQRERYREYMEELQGIVVPIHTKEQTLSLVRQYVRAHPWSMKDNSFVTAYREQRNNYEQGLTINKSGATLNPRNGLKAYKRSSITQATNYDPRRQVALIGMRQFYFDQRLLKGNQFNHRKALELEQPVKTAIKKYFVGANYSNSNLTTISVKSIHQHRVLKTWAFERYQQNDLVFSRVDEEVLNLRKKEELEYLGLFINSSSTNRKFLIPQNTSISILTLFDIESESIVYVGRNSISLGPQYGAFNQMFYLRSL